MPSHSSQHNFQEEQQIREKYPQLFQFFGGYFHQDWDLEFSADIDQAISSYIKNSQQEILEQVKKELKNILHQNFDEAYLEKLLRAFGCYYRPRSCINFFITIQNKLDKSPD